MNLPKFLFTFQNKFDIIMLDNILRINQNLNQTTINKKGMLI